MSEAWAEHVLDEAEAARFEEQGYLVVPDALDEADHAELLAAVDACRRLLRDEWGVGADDRVLLSDVLSLAPAYFELIDCATTFPKVCDVLGWNIHVYHTNLCIAPPARGDSCRQHFLFTHNPRLSRSSGPEPTGAAWQWHRDSGQVNQDLGPPPHPRISVKVAYFLTDTLDDGDGNLFVVPGSHKDYREVQPPRKRGPLAGSEAVRVAARTAVLFDRRILHSSSPNTGQRTRKVLFYGYSHRWFRPRDEMTVDGLLMDASPVRRQLLGAGLGSYGYSSPSDAEVPLRAAMEAMAEARRDRVPVEG
jgi:ectoine hydroxylase